MKVCSDSCLGAETLALTRVQGAHLLRECQRVRHPLELYLHLLLLFLAGGGGLAEPGLCLFLSRTRLRKTAILVFVDGPGSDAGHGFEEAWHHGKNRVG